MFFLFRHGQATSVNNVLVLCVFGGVGGDAAVPTEEIPIISLPLIGRLYHFLPLTHLVMVHLCYRESLVKV